MACSSKESIEIVKELSKNAPTIKRPGFWGYKREKSKAKTPLQPDPDDP